MTRRILIWNEGSGKADSIVRLKSLIDDADVIEINRKIDLPKELLKAVRTGCETVIAAGGDGTVNAVVNGIMQLEVSIRPTLAIIPLGTANDFAGTLGIPDTVEDALAVIDNNQCLPIDIVRISSENFERYYANIAAGGNCVRVSEGLTEEVKATWGAFCYMRGAVGVLSDMHSFHLIADCDNERFELDSWALLVANGKTNAGRIMVAPKASPTDGLIDVIIIRDGSVLDMMKIVSTSLLGNFLECDQVIFRQVKQVQLHSVPGMRFTIDGEVIDEEPVKFEVVPGAVRMFVGSSL